ncbi:hypothetical protein PHYPSEUDO_001231 [Phytophthora pseudosyringae]|uniref:Uncharacterized protein n=1 Tax=Phytophthora pseudosyringae TaxID=221518 RepID=A0A8T1V5V1_9STRA|nr:hypothetical protein PHYPSEUDO_001231 [Phytophthora pseudosyringae]
MAQHVARATQTWQPQQCPSYPLARHNTELAYLQADFETYGSERPADLIFSNAALQRVSAEKDQEVLPRLFAPEAWRRVGVSNPGHPSAAESPACGRCGGALGTGWSCNAAADVTEPYD